MLALTTKIKFIFWGVLLTLEQINLSLKVTPFPIWQLIKWFSTHFKCQFEFAVSQMLFQIVAINISWQSVIRCHKKMHGIDIWGYKANGTHRVIVSVRYLCNRFFHFGCWFACTSNWVRPASKIQLLLWIKIKKVIVKSGFLPCIEVRGNEAS